MNGRPHRFPALILACLLATGCSSSYVVLVDSPDAQGNPGHPGGIVVTTPAGRTEVGQANQGVKLDGKAQAVAIDPQRIQRDFGAALQAQPKLPVSYSLYFESGGAELTPASKQTVRELLQTVRERGPSAISVVGHTDTLGSPRVNEQLGLERAQAIAKMLQDSGLQSLELVVTSHGERNLLVPTPDETSEPRNRRVEVVVR